MTTSGLLLHCLRLVLVCLCFGLHADIGPSKPVLAGASQKDTGSAQRAATSGADFGHEFSQPAQGEPSGHFSVLEVDEKTSFVPGGGYQKFLLGQGLVASLPSWQENDERRGGVPEASSTSCRLDRPRARAPPHSVLSV